MMELLRNCSHESETSTYLVTESTIGKKIIKVAASTAGIKSLEREMEGCEWYQQARYLQRKRPCCLIIQKKAGYLKIEIEYIEGVKADYRRGLERNGSLLKKVMVHYCDIWPYYPDGLSVLHGDLSLDNIIYNAEGVHIIDWEHFNREGAPWGFDAVYLLFETLYFGMKKRKQPSLRELAIIADNITLLNRHKQLSINFIKSPLKTIKDFIVTSPMLWGDHLSAIPRKLPIVSFTDDQVSLIDDAVYSRTKAML